MAGLGPVAELVATLGLEVDESAFDSGLALIGELKKGLLGVGVAVVGAVAGLAGLAVSSASAANENRALAESAGLSTEAFQELSYAATSAEVDVFRFRSALVDLSERAVAAASGSEEASKAFARVGVDVRENGQIKDSATLFYELADAFRQMPNGARKAALATAVFGGSGAKLLPVLNKGSEGLRELAAEAREYGVVTDREVFVAAKKFGAEVKRLKAALGGLQDTIGEPFIDVFRELVVVLREGVVAITQLVKEPVARWADRVSKSLQFLRKNFFLVKWAIGTLIAFELAKYLVALGLMTSAQVAWGAAALLSWVRATAAAAAHAVVVWAATLPYIALAALIAGLINDIYVFTQGGESALGNLIKWLDSPGFSDNALLRLLKAGGSLLFDLSDPQKWSAVWEAWKNFWGGAFKWLFENYIMWLPKKIVAALSGIKFSGPSFEMRSGTPTQAEATEAERRRYLEALQGPTLGQRTSETLTGVADWASMAARDVRRTTAFPLDAPGASRTSNSFNAQISVNVPPGTSSEAMGPLFRETLDSWWDGKMQENYVVAR